MNYTIQFAFNYTIMAIQVALIIAVVIYVVHTLILSKSDEHNPAHVLPIVAWFVVLPIILVSISQLGIFAVSNLRLTETATNSTGWYRVVEVLQMAMAVLCLSVFILGFARCVYTVNLLDMDKWWSIDRFRSRFILRRYARWEISLRTLIALTFAYHQTTILVFLGYFSEYNHDRLGMSWLFRVMDSLQYWLIYAALPTFPGATESEKLASIQWFCITGLIVFLLIYFWSEAIRRSLKAALSSNPSEATKDEKTIIEHQVRQQRWTGLFGSIVMIVLWAVYSFLRDPIGLSIFLLAIVVLLLFVIVRVFIPNLHGVVRSMRNLPPLVPKT